MLKRCVGKILAKAVRPDKPKDKKSKKDEKSVLDLSLRELGEMGKKKVKEGLTNIANKTERRLSNWDNQTRRYKKLQVQLPHLKLPQFPGIEEFFFLYSAHIWCIWSRLSIQ